MLMKSELQELARKNAEVRVSVPRSSSNQSAHSVPNPLQASVPTTHRNPLPTSVPEFLEKPYVTYCTSAV